jgi:hypothetical protein
MKYFIVSVLLFISMGSFSQQKSDTAMHKAVCPVCKTAKHTIPVVYGKPSAEGIRKAERGEVKLGGCIVSEHSAKHFCKKDGRYY